MLGAALAAWKFGKTVFAFLLTPPMLYVTIACAAALGAYTYHVHAVEAAYTRGVNDTAAKYKPVFDKLHAYADATKKGIEAQKAGQAQIVNDLKQKLDKAEHARPKTQVIYKEVTKYVSQESDARCVVPVGFVRFHDAGVLGGGTDSEATVAGGGPPDVGASSGIALSTVAATVRDNYAECQLRKEVIESWQSWYTRNKPLFEKVFNLPEPELTAPLQ